MEEEFKLGTEEEHSQDKVLIFDEEFNEEGDLCEFCARYGMIGDEHDKNFECVYCGKKRERNK